MHYGYTTQSFLREIEERKFRKYVKNFINKTKKEDKKEISNKMKFISKKEEDMH